MAAMSSDGKLWFVSGDGVSIIDPRHIPFNKLPPPVHVEQITANHTVYDATSTTNGQMRLPRWFAIWRSTTPRSAWS